MTVAHQVGQYRIVDERQASRPARGRRRRRHRRRRAIAAVAALTAAGLAVGAADAGRGPGARALPLDPVESQIRERLEPVNSVQSVRCPATPQRAGHTFECIAILAGGQRLPVTVEQLDDRGRVRVQPHV
jgi:Domain of unknown function (DUF4333)